MNEPNPENSSASARGETVNARQCHGSAELLHSQELLCPASVNQQLLCLLGGECQGQHRCSVPAQTHLGQSQGQGAEEETKVERTSHGHLPNWSPVQRISSALVVAVFQFRLPGLRQYKTHCWPQSQLQLLGLGREPWTTPLSSYWNLTGAKRHLVKGSQALAEAPAHPCVSGSQVSWCFPAGKTEYWSSHCQNYSGNAVADSWCFYSPSDTPKYNGMLLWTSQIQKILGIWIFITPMISCQKVDFYTMKTIQLHIKCHFIPRVWGFFHTWKDPYFMPQRQHFSKKKGSWLSSIFSRWK